VRYNSFLRHSIFGPSYCPWFLCFWCVQGLAKCIAWDGEGATCLMEIEVTGAASDADARTVAKSVAGSSLAKSAIFGHDPNWGRIAAAAGYSGEHF
jgi:glutamate N-acetyltransferase/amino-acid N-acetyltransferase